MNDHHSRVRVGTYRNEDSGETSIGFVIHPGASHADIDAEIDRLIRLDFKHAIESGVELEVWRSKLHVTLSRSRLQHQRMTPQKTLIRNDECRSVALL
jgi:hypothetical protein